MYQKETIPIIVPIWATLGLLAFFFDGEADLAIRVGRGGGSNFCFCAASWLAPAARRAAASGSLRFINAEIIHSEPSALDLVN